ncbi:hypothetical protein [Pseudaminobacter sp. NGMCC 1.201702]|uniref:hypothetical protein n=1 Tax=Pseudaminobacter sp. NGMCC 1.201702 TaxID=3391825 RepID=UPI0039F07E00
MRPNFSSGILAAMLLAFGAGTPALAGGDHDRVYADSFGNLIVDSAAGYKRIVVGQGHLARNLRQYTRSGAPKVAYFDEHAHIYGDCYRPPVLVKGRSYMYGFDQGEIPLQGGPCR